MASSNPESAMSEKAASSGQRNAMIALRVTAAAWADAQERCVAHSMLTVAERILETQGKR